MENKYEHLSDERLVAMAQAGNLEAEEHLIRTYKSMVRHRAKIYFIMGSDGDDVVQEGMIGIFKAIRSYKEGKDTSFRTFAELCVNRQIATAIKTANRMKHSPLNTSVSLNLPLVKGEKQETLQETLPTDSNWDPEELLILKDVARHILTNDSKLFSQFEMQVWNEYLQGKDYKEIAKALGKTAKSVDNAMQRTRKKIFNYICQ